MISTVTTTTTTVTTAEIMAYSIIAVVSLIIFLILKEVLSAESDKNIHVKSFVKRSNIAIYPLLLVFIAIVVYKMTTLI